jgi:hypothetical protein
LHDVDAAEPGALLDLGQEGITASRWIKPALP